jgi:hypothetical protein
MKGGRKWELLEEDEKLEVVKDIREAVRDYEGWERIFQEAFDDRPRNLERKRSTEQDGKPPETSFPRGKGESEQHRQLKEWARDNPGEIGLPRGFEGEVECDLLSGDRVDVLFTRGEEFAVVEVQVIPLKRRRPPSRALPVRKVSGGGPGNAPAGQGRRARNPLV